jgi:hypothetical protein
MEGLDVSRLSRVVVERVSQLLDAGGQSRIAYDTALPYGAEQLLLADERAGVLRQGKQQLGRLQG